MRKKTFLAILFIGLSVLCMTGCDGSSSSSTSYDYYDSKGNGYNDEDVDWSGKDKSGSKKGWDEAVDDWNRANGY